MDGNNGIDPDAHGDVDHNLGTLPVWDFVLDPIAHSNRGSLCFGDYDPNALASRNWDKLIADIKLKLYPDIRGSHRFPYGDRYPLIDFDAYKHIVSDLVSDTLGQPKPDAEPVFIDNSFHDIDAIYNRDSITYAIIKRHLDAAYAEVAATLLGAASSGEEGDPDAEAKAAPEAGIAFDCWS